MNSLVHLIQAYLAEVLGAPTSPAKIRPVSGLPFHLKDSFDLVQLQLLGNTVMLAIDKAPGTLAPAVIASRLQNVRAKAGLVLYAAPALSYDVRRRLIEHKVPFVVPGNQLYLPDLGIDLREHFRRRAEEASTAKLSPSTQAMLLRHLLDRMGDDAANTDWQVAATARALGYTVMTGSRAANEVVALGLGEIERRNRSIHIKFMAKTSRGIWEAAKAHIRTPIARTHWLAALPPDLAANARLAGLTALSKQTLLSDPEHAVYALHRDAWLQVADRPALPRPEPGAVEIQVWSYSPALLERQPAVDPLSLIASLRDDPDERVQSVLKDFEAKLPWGEGWMSSQRRSAPGRTSTS